jgi:homogentisate phytyltransferase/homogentisate geranylgeranyltransferase
VLIAGDLFVDDVIELVSHHIIPIHFLKQSVRVFFLMHRLLTATFFGVAASFFRGSLLASATPSLLIGRAAVGLSSLLAGISVQKEAAPVNPEDPKEVYNFYMHLWKLFYLSYLVLPLAR